MDIIFIVLDYIIKIFRKIMNYIYKKATIEDVVTKLNKSVDLIDTSQVIPGSTVDSEIKK